MNEELLKISDVSAALKVPYQRVFLAVCEGIVPAHRDPKNQSRWLVRKDDLPKIREILGVDNKEVA